MGDMSDRLSCGSHRRAWSVTDAPNPASVITAGMFALTTTVLPASFANPRCKLGRKLGRDVGEGVIGSIGTITTRVAELWFLKVRCRIDMVSTHVRRVSTRRKQ